MANKIFDAMGLVHEFSKQHGVTQRGGKVYTQVVHRMEAFRQVFGLECGVDTQVIVDDGQRVVVKAIITNENGHVIGSGMAEEIRGDGHVNKTSALENCETSAVGRALASLGLSGGEYASANEIEAVSRKEKNLKSQAGGSTDGPPPQSSAPPPEPQDERQREKDKDFYMEVAGGLQSKSHRIQVENFFVEMKPRIKEMRDRDADKAQHIMALFEKKLAEFN